MSDDNKNKIESLLSYFRPDPNKDAQMIKRTKLVPETKGLGRFEKPSEEDLKKDEQKRIDYMPYHKRRRNDDDNYDYIKMESTIINKILSQNSSQIIDQEKSSIKEETDDNYCDEDWSKIYNNPKYNFFDHKYNTTLPIFEIKDQIIEALTRTNIVIIQGNTGCGKTTQVPQIILDDQAKKMQNCRILITQPRKIAAKSIAQRVCQERNWELGSICGYKVSLDVKTSKLSKLIYLTTGYLLEQIIGNNETLNFYTHIIIDEIHDREIDTDLLILIIKVLLLRKYTGKIILMSATLDPELYIRYFKEQSLSRYIPILKCETKMHKVKEYYLDDLSHFPSFSKIQEYNELEFPELHSVLLEMVYDLLNYFDEKEIEQAKANKESTINNFAAERGAVLIFAPGWNEINQISNFLSENMSKKGLVIVPLHSEISLDEQMKAFKIVSAGKRKVIVSTSIAESSITVPDTKYVIDFCLTKCLKFDEATNLTQLKVEWSSKSNLDQRKGRAGRVSHGRCYRLITHKFFKNLYEFPRPAIENQPLDKLLLSLKRFNLLSSYDLRQILSLSLTPPKLDNIERTVVSLKEVGALSIFKNGEHCKHDGDLTFAGKIMGELPVDIKLGKLILLGHSFGKLREAIVLASALSVTNIFGKWFKCELEDYINKLNWSQELFCDFHSIINAYNVWDFFKITKKFKDKMNEKSWIEANNLNIKALYEIQDLKKKIEKSLEKYDIRIENEMDRFNEHVNLVTEQDLIDENYILKFMIAGAFYPNYYRTKVRENDDDLQRVLSCKNPLTTIAISNFPTYENHTFLYHNQIKSIFERCSNDVILDYEKNKAFVEFPTYDNPNTKFARGLHAAIYMSKVKNYKIEVTPIDCRNREYSKVIDKIQQLKTTESVNYHSNSAYRLTTGRDHIDDINLLVKNVNEFKFEIVHVNTVGEFWATMTNNKHVLDKIERSLNIEDRTFNKLDKNKLKVNQLVVTLHIDSDNSCTFARAKIVQIKPECVNVFYIDYGNYEEKDFNLIFDIYDELKNIPHQAFKCQLAHLRVNPLKKNEDNQLCAEFSTYLSKKKLKAKIYSIMHNVARVTVIDTTKELFHKDISDDLIKIGLFEYCEESEESQAKYKERYNSNYINREINRSTNESISIKDLSDILDSLKLDKTSKKIELSVRSPLESRLNSTVRCLENYDVKIERSSINYVLLEDEPQVKCSNLIVAYKKHLVVCEHTNRSRVYLSQTCLFPKIRGLVSLCLLIFSPIVELRACPINKIYTGALCGLGIDNLGKPLNSENDIENVFEIDIDDTDIRRINLIRDILNTMIGNVSNYLKSDTNRLRKFQKDNRKSILALLQSCSSKFKKIGKLNSFHKAHKWGQIREEAYSDYNHYIKKSTRKLNRNKYFSQIRTVNFYKL